MKPLSLGEELLERGRFGPWQRVAAVAGDGAAVMAVATLVNSHFLGALGAHPSERDLAQVAANVESLAAGRRGALAFQSSQWPSPGQVPDQAAFDVAWATALRHLPDWPDLESAGPAVEGEAALLRRLVTEPLTWQQVVERVATAPRPAFAIRWAGTCPLLDEHVTGGQMDGVPFGVLRALRGRAELLDDAGRGVVERVAVQVEDPAEAALAVELADELGLTVRKPATIRLLERLDLGLPPDDAAPLVYVLLTDWRVP